MAQLDLARQALADYEARHGAFQPAQVRPRMPGDDPRFAPARDRLVAALGRASAR